MWLEFGPVGSFLHSCDDSAWLAGGSPSLHLVKKGYAKPCVWRLYVVCWGAVAVVAEPLQVNAGSHMHQLHVVIKEVLRERRPVVLGPASGMLTLREFEEVCA